jgi:cell cycle checkpoint protein
LCSKPSQVPPSNSSNSSIVFALHRMLMFGLTAREYASPWKIQESCKVHKIQLHWKHVNRCSQGVAFLDKALFTSFIYNRPVPDNEDDESDTETPNFHISLPALLETLQIFGASDSSSRFHKPDTDYNTNIRPHRLNPFSNQTLGMSGVCRLSYSTLGSSFSIILEEPGVTTTCNLNTYESGALEEIPFNRDQLEVKVIMRSRYLFDAISEISSITSSSSTSSSRLTIIASPSSPYLYLSASGPFGSSSIEFSKSRELLETFTVTRRWSQSYPFEMIKAATEAMRLATKVSFRSDRQGVLSLQFMVELEGGAVSFVEFRFVPFVSGEGDPELELEDNREE